MTSLVQGRAALLIVFAALAARLVLIALPFPYLPDVYYYDTQAVKALVAGLNPYGFAYVVPAALATPGAANVFAYLPGVLIVLVPFGVLTDVRLALVACDLLVALGLYAIRGRRGRVSAIVFLILPFTAFFSAWFPNDALVGMAFLGLSIASWERQHRMTAAGLMGLALASSQFIWLAYPFLLLRDLKLRHFREIAVAVGVAGAVIAPFAVWNLPEFAGDVLVFATGRPAVGLVTYQPWFSLNPGLSGLVLTVFGASVPLLLKAAILLPLLAYLLRRTLVRGLDFLDVTFFVTAAVFVLPSVFFWAYLEFPFQTLLIWYSLSAKGTPAS